MAQGQATKIKKKKKSVLKRAAQSEQRAEVNRANRTRVRTAIKKLRGAITAGDARPGRRRRAVRRRWRQRRRGVGRSGGRGSRPQHP